MYYYLSGNYINGKKNGYGLQIWSNKTKYDGKFKNIKNYFILIWILF